MNAGHFRFKNVSTGDLNRGRRTESRVLFGYFLHDAKSDNSFPFRETPRFCKPRISTPQPQLRTATIKTFQGSFEVLQTSNQRTKQQLPTNNLKSFRRRRRPFCGKAAFPLPVATQYRRLRRRKRRAVLSVGTPCTLFYILQGSIPFFAGTHLDDIFYIVYKDLAIADMTGV